MIAVAVVALLLWLLRCHCCCVAVVVVVVVVDDVVIAVVAVDSFFGPICVARLLRSLPQERLIATMVYCCIAVV